MGHLVAVLLMPLVFGVAALALYGGVVFYNATSAADLGGPLNFIIIPVFVGLHGAAISVVVFLPLALLAERFGFIRWLQVSAVLSVVSIGATVVVALSKEARQFLNEENARMIVAAILWLTLVEGFTIYLSCLALFRRFFP